MDYEDKLEAVDRKLAEALDRICDEVAGIVAAGGELAEPDSVLAALDEHTAELCSSVEALIESVGRAGGASRFALNDVLERVLSRHLDQIQFPVVVQTSFDTELPRVELPLESVRAVLEKAIGSSLGFAGHGGELSVATRVDGDAATCKLTACRESGTPAVAATDYAARFESVREFIDRLGGSLELEIDGDAMLGVVLVLPVGSRV